MRLFTQPPKHNLTLFALTLATLPIPLSIAMPAPEPAATLLSPSINNSNSEYMAVADTRHAAPRAKPTIPAVLYADDLDKHDANDDTGIDNSTALGTESNSATHTPIFTFTKFISSLNKTELVVLVDWRTPMLAVPTAVLE